MRRPSAIAMLSPDELDRAYNARAAIPDHAAIFARWRDASARTRDRLRCEAGCRYGPSAAETLDFFPSRLAKAPLLVFIHGGYWRALDKSDFSFVAEPYVATGIAVAVVNYALLPAVTLDDIVRQMLRALAWLHREEAALNIDPGRVVVAGHSAGGHLAAMLACADWPLYGRDLPPRLVRGIVGISGLYDLVPLAHAPFLSADLRLDDAAAVRASPVTYRPPQPLPVVTAVGELESDEFRRQQRLLAQAWPGCPLSEVPLPGRHHLSAVEALAEPGHDLYRATLKLLGR